MYIIINLKSLHEIIWIYLINADLAYHVFINKVWSAKMNEQFVVISKEIHIKTPKFFGQAIYR